MVYFVEGNSVGSEFGFPRVDTKKRYRWKKMNFTTDLPKKRPYVTYIVASAVKCERFFPKSKDEGPLYRMHAVILNKDRIHTQKYKSKSSSQTHNECDENSQSLSSTCSSTESMELEKNDMNIEELSEFKKSPKKPEKNYILCHIRKIDSNYKTRTYNKKSTKEEVEAEEQEDEDEEETACGEDSSKKLFCSNGSVIPAKEKDTLINILENNTPPKIKTFKLVSADLLDQLMSKSDSNSPFEKGTPKSTVTQIPGLSKNSLLGLSSRKSAFNSFQGSFTPPKIPILTSKNSHEEKKEEQSPMAIEEKKIEKKHQKPLFEAFSKINGASCDYFQLFTSLISLNKN